jgi:hypothetical protein
MMLVPVPYSLKLLLLSSRSSNTVEEFQDVVNARYQESSLKEGYAPFCKHLFILNDFTQAKVNVLKITGENEIHLRSSYEARNEKELPVLLRFFPKALIKDDDLPVAKYLDLILYSREQINKVSNYLIGCLFACVTQETG